MPIVSHMDLVIWQRLREKWRYDPVNYMEFRLGITPTDQQKELLWAIVPEGAKVSVRAGHNVGKTTALAVIVLWYMECFDFAKIPCTAPSASQLRDVLWSELSKLLRKSDLAARYYGIPQGLWLSDLLSITQTRVEAIGYKNWFAVARTARKEAPDALQGFHASDIDLKDGQTVETMKVGEGGNLLFIVDEAPGVPDEVFHVAEGALAGKDSRLVMIGNPTKKTGYFADSHLKNRANFTTMHFRCSDSPLPDPNYRDRLVKNWGENSNMVRVRADGEFPLQDDTALISLEWVLAAMKRDAPLVSQEPIRLGVDVARFGDDRTVLTIRQGRHIQYIEIHSKEDTMVTAGRVAALFQTRQIDEIFVDVVGLGAGVADRLRELGLPVVDVNVAEAAPERRKDIDSIEMIPWKLRDWLWLESMKFFRFENPSFEGCDKDHVETLAGELTTVGYAFNSSGCAVVWGKDKLKKDGFRSCDIADSLNLTFAPSSANIWERL